MTILTLCVLDQTTMMLDPKVLQGGIIILMWNLHHIFFLVQRLYYAFHRSHEYLYLLYCVAFAMITTLIEIVSNYIPDCNIIFKYVKGNCFRLLLSLPLEERMQKLLSEVCSIILAMQNFIILIIRIYGNLEAGHPACVCARVHIL